MLSYAPETNVFALPAEGVNALCGDLVGHQWMWRFLGETAEEYPGKNIFLDLLLNRMVPVTLLAPDPALSLSKPAVATDLPLAPAITLSITKPSVRTDLET